MIRNAIKYIRFGGGKYKCIACGKSVRKFFKISNSLVQKAKENGFQYDFRRMETLNYDQCNCPFCLTTDRERLYLIFIEEYIIKQKKSDIKILDFAPNKFFASYLKKKQNLEYYSADLFREDVNFKVDICDMFSLNDSSFDFIICSHILEHVEDPDKALRELKRILKPGGAALIMVPLFWDVKESVEDKNHKSEKEKLEFYGQADHVRLFSKVNFTERITAAGFLLKEFHTKDFNSQMVKDNAISSNSILYIGYKK